MRFHADTVYVSFKGALLRKRNLHAAPLVS